MTFFFTYYTTDFTNALLVGTVLGAVTGLIFFTSQSAGAGVQRVITGMLIGGLLMAVFQALLLGTEVGGVFGLLGPVFGFEKGITGGMLTNATVWIVQGALLGGALMLISFAPFRALQAVIGGGVVGSVAGMVTWGVLQALGVQGQVFLFSILALGIILFVFELLPFGQE